MQSAPQSTQQTTQQQTTTRTQTTTKGQGTSAGPTRTALRGMGYVGGAAALSSRAPGDEDAIVAGLKAEMSALLGMDLSAVRVSLSAADSGTGVEQAGEVRLGLSAAALQTREGRTLFAHEMVHAGQALVAGAPGNVEDCEAEADALATRLADGQPVRVGQSADPGQALYHHGDAGYLTRAQERSAIRYNRRLGYSRERVRRIQNVIGVPDDGLWGPITVEQVAHFQARNGLSVDGKVGRNTRAAIDDQQHDTPAAPATAPTPQPRPESAPLQAGQLSAHFSASEFRSKDGSATPAWVVPNLRELAENLEVLRAACGGRSISITSGYRSPSHNRRVGWARRSQHLSGRAADLNVSGMSPRQVKAKIEELISAGRMKQGGVGLYSGFVHYDTRGYRARW